MNKNDLALKIIERTREFLSNIEKYNAEFNDKDKKLIEAINCFSSLDYRKQAAKLVLAITDKDFRPYVRSGRYSGPVIPIGTALYFPRKSKNNIYIAKRYHFGDGETFFESINDNFWFFETKSTKDWRPAFPKEIFNWIENQSENLNESFLENLGIENNE